MAKLPRGVTKLNNGTYRVRIRLLKRGIDFDEVFDTLDAALAAAEEKRATQRTGQATALNTSAVKEARTMTVGDLMRWYLDRLTSEKENGKTLYMYGYDSDAKNLAAKSRYWLNDETAYFIGATGRTQIFVRDVLVDNLLPANLESWWKGLDPRPSSSTVSKRLDVISKAVKGWNRINHGPARFPNPVEGHKIKPPTDPSRERRFQPGEKENVLSACSKSLSKWLKPCVVLAIETTLREQEIVNLSWSDVNFETKFLRATNLKNEQVTFKFIPLNETAISALEELLELSADYPEGMRGKVLPIKTTRGIIHAFNTALEKTDPRIVDFHFHDLRHEGISQIVDNNPNINPLQLAAMTGHSDLSTLQKYFTAERLALQEHIETAHTNRAKREFAKQKSN